MNEVTEKRFSLLCDLDGRVIEIMHDDDRIISSSIIGNMLFSIIVPGDLDKILNFFLELKNKRTAIGWEINVKTSDGAGTFSFFGGIFNDRIGIAASTRKNGAQQLFAELTRINNEQTNIIRSLAKENVKMKTDPDEPAVAYYEELSRLNNDLINMQRELAKKNRELDELNKLKNQFLGIAAHDLRNPLGVIMGYSSFLLEESEGHWSDDQIKMLKSISSSSEFMLHLLNNLLDISSIESGKLNLDLNRSDIVKLIERNVELNSVIAHKKNINISFTYMQKIPDLLIDTGKIEQVLNNLISNAVKFSHPGNDIYITIQLKGNEAVIAVADHGQGIPEPELHKLFKPFEKNMVKSTAGEKSTGLGLSIVRKLVEGHNGNVWVESKKGEGSVFYFSLPVEPVISNR